MAAMADTLSEHPTRDALRTMLLDSSVPLPEIESRFLRLLAMNGVEATQTDNKTLSCLIDLMVDPEVRRIAAEVFKPVHISPDQVLTDEEEGGRRMRMDEEELRCGGCRCAPRSGTSVLAVTTRRQSTTAQHILQCRGKQARCVPSVANVKPHVVLPGSLLH